MGLYLIGKLKFQTHRPMIERFATDAGLNGKVVATNLEELFKMYNEMLSRKPKGAGLSKSDKLLLCCQAKLAHVDLSDILGV